MHEIWPQLRFWVESNTPFTLATVVEARNPSPRGIGACLAICEEGKKFIGSVSAGCVESEVIERAQACSLDGTTRWAEFGPSQGMPWEVALSCGGKIKVRIERFSYDTQVTPRLIECLNTHQSGLWISGPNQQALLTDPTTFIGDESQWSPETIERARQHLRQSRSTKEVDTEEGSVLFRILQNPKRLFIIGAVHISTHLVTIARSLNYQTIVIDPRQAYAQSERFSSPPDQLINSWPAQSLNEFHITDSDCFALLTHDPKIDDDALSILLKSSCHYIGALGSRKSHAARLKRLSKIGFPDDTLKRIHGPIGLDIGSRTPAEIAISIMAEIIKTQNDRPQPILG